MPLGSNEQVADIGGMRVGLGNETDQNEAKRAYDMSDEQKVLFDDIFKLIQEGKSKDALSLAATPFKHMKDWKERAKTITLTGRTVDGKREDLVTVGSPGLTGAETTRLTDLEARTQIYLDFSRGGLAALQPTDQTTLLDEAKRYIQSDPELTRLYGDAAGTAVDEAKVRLLIESRQFKNLLVGKLNEAFADTTESRIKELENAHLQAWEALKKKEAEKTQKEQQKTDARTEKNNAQTEKATFETATTGGGNTNLDKLNDLETDADVKAIVELKDLVIAAERALENNQNTNMTRHLQTEVASAKKDYRDAKAKLQRERAAAISAATAAGTPPPPDVDRKIRQYEALKDQYDRINRRLDAADKAIAGFAELDKQIAEIDIELRKLRIAEDNARRDRERISESAPDDINNIMYDAVQQHIDVNGPVERQKARSAMEKVQAEQKTKKEKGDTDELTRIKDQISHSIQTKYLMEKDVPNPKARWWKPSEPWTVKGYAPDMSLIQTDREALFNPSHGPDVIVRKVLLDSVCPAAHNGVQCNDADSRGRYDKLRGEKQYVDSVRDDVMVTMLKGMVDAGQPPNAAEINYLANSKQMAPIVDKYMARSKEVESFVKKYQTAGLLPKDMASHSTLKEIIKRFGPTLAFSVLFAALGFGDVGAFATMIGTKALGKGWI